jgi:uncharacterized protein involved in response to NO
MGAGRLPTAFNAFDVATLGVSAAALLLWIVYPDAGLTGALFLLAAVLQGARLWRWAGIGTWREPLVLILHIGYAFVPLGFLLGAICIFAPGALGGTAALHTWTVGAIGTMTLAVMTRATRSHTGRALAASRLTVVIYAAILSAAALRIAAGAAQRDFETLIEIAGVAWIAAFALFLIE